MSARGPRALSGGSQPPSSANRQGLFPAGREGGPAGISTSPKPYHRRAQGGATGIVRFIRTRPPGMSQVAVSSIVHRPRLQEVLDE